MAPDTMTNTPSTRQEMAARLRAMAQVKRNGYLTYKAIVDDPQSHAPALPEPEVVERFCVQWKDLEAGAAALLREQAQAWQPIETAPKDNGQDLIICDGNGLVGHGFFNRADGRWDWLDGDPIRDAQYWQHFPPSPERSETP